MYVLVSGGVGGEWCELTRGMGFGFTTPVGTSGVLDVFMCLVLVLVIGPFTKSANAAASV